MGQATVDGLTLGYRIIGQTGRPWVITPGGRYSKDDPGIKELAEAVAAGGNRVLIWDRPNCGESDVCFEGPTESDMQADALAGLLRHLELAPAVIMGGSGGARVSLLAAAHHPDVTAGLAVLWISGGIFGLMTPGMFYCGNSIASAWAEGMEAVANLDDWAEPVKRNAGNRQRILDQDRKKFIETMERWLMAYYPHVGELVPGLSDAMARTINVPTLVFRSGESDAYHPRATSEAVARLIPNSWLIEPSWPDTEWHDGQLRRAQRRQTGTFERWPVLAPQLLAWAGEVFG